MTCAISSSWAKDVKKASLYDCPGGILPQNDFVQRINHKKEVDQDGIISESSTSKLINTTGKCFNVKYSEFIYLIDKDQAIYKVTTDDYFNPWVMVDFNKKPAPLSTFKGVLKGVGKYTYKDGKGIPRNIPYMIVVR
jgi:hypothetical protein